MYKPVIGLEIHVELKTQSKMFCRCSADYFGKPQNSHVCPVCLGMPGALPVPNKKAVEWTILIGQALGCKINLHSKFDRKHYFYPDLPKGYQISQYDEPLSIQGLIELKVPHFVLTESGTSRGKKNFRIKRVHLEEDTGKLIHSNGKTLVDFNRSGVPLVEIVTEPDFDNADDVKTFLEELHTIIRYLGVSDADMEKGSMRLEPNISVQEISNSKIQDPKKFQLPNYKVEIKNINSFNFVKRAIEYEIKRQTELLEKGETPKQETRGYDEKKDITYSQRTKEEAHDYRYFPEPDIPEMEFAEEYIQAIQKQLPELPAEKAERYVKEFGIRESDAFILTREISISNIFEMLSLKFKVQSSKLRLKVKNLEQILANLIVNKKIDLGKNEEELIEEIIQLITPKETDMEKLGDLINQLIETHKNVVEDYKKGKTNAIMFLVGQVMKEMKGKADAKVVREEIEKRISN